MITVFRDNSIQELLVKLEGYVDLLFQAKIPTPSEIDELRLQLATTSGIGNEHIYDPSFNTLLGYEILNRYLKPPYPGLIIAVFNELPKEEKSWKYFPDTEIYEGILNALLDKIKEQEAGKKKSKALDALRKPVKLPGLLHDPSSENISGNMEEPGVNTGLPKTSDNSDGLNDRPAEKAETSLPGKSKGVRHRMQSN